MIAHKHAAAITRAASLHTYYTIRFLVDRPRRAAAFRTYAYFRWVDDMLDEHLEGKTDRRIFIERQQALMVATYRHAAVTLHCQEEQMLVDLIHSDPAPDSGLHTYIRCMMAVMAFDAARRHHVICRRELAAYTRNLAVAVTEAMHYFIGHGQAAPTGEARYAAVTGAHITHMLRDTHADSAAGYFNIPREFLEAHHLDPHAIESEAYREWVKERVEVARDCFERGRGYLRQVQSRRCRLAGYAYLARFERVLGAITRDGFALRPSYSARPKDDRTPLVGGLKGTAS